MVEYFDDMWLALEQELTQHDSYLSERDWMSSNPATPSPGEMRNDPLNEPQDRSVVAPVTYEELLNLNQEPSNSQLRSRSREERIEAVRQLYNQIPTIISASALAQAHRVANKLYRVGKVKEADTIVAEAERTINKSFTYIDSDDTYEKSIDVHSNNGEMTANVQIVDKIDNSTIRRTFDNVLEAVKFFLSAKDEKED